MSSRSLLRTKMNKIEVSREKKIILITQVLSNHLTQVLLKAWCQMHHRKVFFSVYLSTVSF